MTKITRRTLFAASTIAPFAGALMASSPPGNVTSNSAREWQRDRYFPNISLFTQAGKRVKFYDDVLKGKIVTLNMFYARCDKICPGITANLVKVQALLGAEVGRNLFMYSLTLKPEEDTPEVLKAYAEMYGVKPGWTFLTGSPKDMELIRVKLGFTNPNPALDKESSQHIGNVRYGNEPLVLWGACPGLAHPSWIVKGISWVARRDLGPPSTGAAS